MSPLALLAVLIAAAMLYEFVNGFHDGANIVATMIASRAMSARGALLLAAVASFAGPFVVGTAVSQTLGAGTVDPAAITVAVAIAAMAAATVWNLLTWWLRIPVSSSHALVGGLLGAAITAAGFEAIRAAGVVRIGIALLVSPILGFVVAFVAMQATYRALRDASPKANLGLSRAQLATAAVVAFSNGANDAHKTAGVVALGLLALGFTPLFAVPGWAIAACAASLSVGTVLGGERIVRTLSSRFYRIRPIHGFASQVSTGAVILGASLAGGPVSSTQVMSMAIVGAGAAERPSKVRWAGLGEIFAAWLLTVPASALLAAPVYLAVAAWIGKGGR